MIRQLFIALVALSVARGAEPAALEAGKAAPEFTVLTRAGAQLKLSDFRDKSHLVIVFGRAHW